MNHDEIVKALNSLVPNARWQLTGNNYDDINWIEGNKPTLEQLENELRILPIKKAQAEAAAKAQKQAILDRLGLTEDELRIVLG